jgi:hypothetical protein
MKEDQQDCMNEVSVNSSEPVQGVIPALGISWTHFVNIRIILQYLNDFQREVQKKFFLNRSEINQVFSIYFL